MHLAHRPKDDLVRGVCHLWEKVGWKIVFYFFIFLYKRVAWSSKVGYNNIRWSHRLTKQNMVPWSSGSDVALSRRKQEFESPRNYDCLFGQPNPEKPMKADASIGSFSAFFSIFIPTVFCFFAYIISNFFLLLFCCRYLSISSFKKVSFLLYPYCKAQLYFYSLEDYG